MQSIFSKLDLVGGKDEGHRSNLQMQQNGFESSYKLQTEEHYQQREGQEALVMNSHYFKWSHSHWF